MSPDPKREFIFKWGSNEEAFSSILGGGAIRFPGLPDLKEVGFRTASGKLLKYGSISKDAFLRKFVTDSPHEFAEALIFQGYLAEDLVVNLKGATPVCRVDIDHGGKVTVLWKNLPVPADLERANPSK